MSETPHFPSEPNRYDDEISISELLMKLWAKRGIIFFLPLVMAGLTIVGLLLSKTTTAEKLVYFVELTGLKDSSYPNGVAFSPQDLLNPQVTVELASQFSINSDVPVGEAVRVTFGSPLSDGVLTEYRAALAANSKATPEEIARLNERYEELISAVAKRGVRIEVNYARLGLSKSEGAEFAYALPRVWSEVFSNKFRIFIDTGIAGIPQVSHSLETDVSSPIGALAADLQLNTMERGLSFLINDSRFRAIQSNGVTPAELGEQISSFRAIYFDPIYSFSFGEDGASNIYRHELLLKQREIEESLEELNDRIAKITQLQSGDAVNVGGSREFSGGGSSQVQIEGDALNQLVNLSRTASLAEYLQVSFDKRIELVQERAKINTRLQKMLTASPIANEFVMDAKFVDSASTSFAQLKKDYGELLAIARQAALSETPSLYEVTSQVQGERLLQRRDFLLILLALALGGMLATIAALVWPQGRTK